MAERAGPLRRIVEVLDPAADAYSRQRVRLDCGHVVRASGGAIYRARCRHCKRTLYEAGDRVRVRTITSEMEAVVVGDVTYDARGGAEARVRTDGGYEPTHRMRILARVEARRG